MINHWVPRFYLKEWADESKRVLVYEYDGILGQWRRSKSKDGKRHIKSIASKRQYYLDSTEQNIGKMETSAAPVIKKLRDGNVDLPNLTNAEKKILGEFISYLSMSYMRPAVKDVSTEDWSEVLETTHNDSSYTFGWQPHWFMLRFSRPCLITSDAPIMTSEGTFWFPIGRQFGIRGNTRFASGVPSSSTDANVYKWLNLSIAESPNTRTLIMHPDDEHYWLACLDDPVYRDINSKMMNKLR